jgi:glycosyltransferase involved in cell wall biosynthesis
MTRMLHVLLMPAWYPSPEAPLEALFMRDLARAISTRNQVTVLAPPSVAANPDEVIDGIRTIRLPNPIRRGRLGTVQWLVALNGTVTRLAGEGSPVDLIHGHYFATGPHSVLVGRLRGLPVVLTENASNVMEGSLSRYQTHLARLSYSRAARVLPDSPLAEQALRRLQPNARYEVVPEVVDVDAFAARRRPSGIRAGRHIVAVANLERRKGFDYLIEAVQQLVTEGRDLMVTLVGEGPDRKRLESQAAGLPVTLVGPRTREEIVSLLPYADVFAMPTLADPFGISAVEAAAAGVPVVVTSAAGCADLLQGYGARVIPPRDAVALRKALAESLDNRECVPVEAADGLRAYCGIRAVGEHLDSIYRSLPGIEAA